MSSIHIEAAPDQVMAVIADFEAYPQWTGAVKEVAVREVGSDGRATQVWFDLDAGVIKDQYTLAYRWDDAREVRWTLVEARQILRSMDGAYVLAGEADGTTTVIYRLVVDLTVPMLGMIKRKAEKVVIETALSELKRRVEG